MGEYTTERGSPPIKLLLNGKDWRKYELRLAIQSTASSSRLYFQELI